MTAHYCTQCGAKLLAEARFCVECGTAIGGARAATVAGTRLPRYAPLFVIVCVLALGSGAVLVGVSNPKTAPPAPKLKDPSAAEAEGSMPAGHPPVQIPEQVKQTIRDMAAQAQAAPTDVIKWKQAAEVQYRAGQIEATYLSEAEASYKHMLGLEPQNLEAIRALGNIAYDRQDAGKAIEYYEQYLKIKPGDLEVQTDLGTMHLAAGRADEALRRYDEVLKVDGKFFQAQFNKAIAFRSKGEEAKTMEALDQARAMAPDETTRTQVDQLIARLKGQPPPAAPMAAAPPATPPAATGASFQADAEAIFKQNPVLGPKVQRVEWTGATAAKVFVRDFPMDQMGAEMKAMFSERMKGRIREKKTSHKVTEAARFEIIDEASGRVMETLSE